DRQDADIHVLGTRQQTGAGGSAYTLELRGRGAFDGERLTVSTTTAPDATEADRRAALVEVVRLALAPFAQATPARPLIEIRAPELEPSGAEVRTDDPWNRWTFRLGVNGFLDGESQQSSFSGFGSASANRVTADWKTLFSVRGSMNRSEFELPDTTVVSRRESYGASALVARSVGQRWGMGGIVEWSRSSFANYDASVVVGPALEFNVFPYAESTRRLLTVLYAIGPRHNDYADVTIFDATRETLLQQLLVVSYDVTQPWGNIDVSAQADHYLATFGDGEEWLAPQFSAQFGGGFDVRLIRGLSARLNGRVAMIRNQIQLPAGELTEEEILTQQRELATNYRYFASVGLSYRFGSIFSDVVNPRFDTFD
ncbi:MAG: hypothetical protein KY466_12445, partial [Gemmatimonadetes bacterium]|nr:hypothetical protein [Gemmatimonadota bacterium]